MSRAVRFDAELSKATSLSATEKTQREKMQRERDELMAQKYSTELLLKNVTLDLELEVEKSARLNRELGELTGSTKEDKEIAKLRQLKNELERKVTDQEEELDEQAGTIQQLEQAKLKLEMGQEKLRQANAKELEEKENALTDLKATMHKKVRGLVVGGGRSSFTAWCKKVKG